MKLSTAMAMFGLNSAAAGANIVIGLRAIIDGAYGLGAVNIGIMVLNLLCVCLYVARVRLIVTMNEG